MKLRIKNTKITTKILGWLQIIGGIYGLGLIISLMLKTMSLNGAILLIFLTGISLFIFSIVSGRYILDKKNLKLGLILSMINFFLQLITIQFEGYGIAYCSGINLLIGYDAGFKFSFGIVNSLFSMLINTDDTNFVFKINIAAIFIMWVLFDIYDEIFPKKDIENEEIISTTANKSVANIRVYEV